MTTNISSLFAELRTQPGVDPAKVDKLVAMIRAVPALEDKRGRVRLNFQQQRSGLAARSHMD